MKRVKLYISMFFILLTNQLFTQDNSIKKEFGGFAELDHISYFENPGTYYDNSRNQGIFQLETKLSMNNKYKCFSSIEFRNDLSTEARNRIYVDELYMDFLFSNIDLRIGKQIVTWGEADVVNPTNNINPVDFSDLLDRESETIGVFSIKGKYYFNNMALEAVLIPTFTKNTLPQHGSRWMWHQAPDNGNDSSYTIEYLPINMEMPSNDLRSSQFALKLSNTWQGIDYSLSYYNGWEHFPYYTSNKSLHPEKDSTIVVSTTVNYLRKQVYGLDFATNLGSIVLKGEAAYITLDKDKENVDNVNDPYIQYVVGLEKTFSNVIGYNNLRFLFEWIHEVSTTGEEFSPYDIKHPFPKTLLTRINLEIGSYTNLLFQGMYNIDHENYYMQPGFEYDIADGLSFTCLVDILGGNKESLIGYFSRNNRVQLKLLYNF